MKVFRGRLGRLSYGGTLSIFNGLSWVCFLAGARLLSGNLPDWAWTALLPLLVFLALPIAVPCLLPSQGLSMENAVINAFVLGVNALLWGHGIVWIVRRIGRRFGWIRVTSSSHSLPDDVAETHYYG